MLDDLLYRRGFLVLPAWNRPVELSYLASWPEHRFGAWRLHTHSETPVRVFGAGSVHPVVILGDVFVAHGTATLEEVAERYAREDMSVSRTSAADSHCSQSRGAGCGRSKTPSAHRPCSPLTATERSPPMPPCSQSASACHARRR